MWPGWIEACIASHVPALCCSCHTFLLFCCYLLFLVTLLIRQLVDWLANVCTTLQTCKVLILSSLLFLLCICLFFTPFLFWCVWGPGVFCDVKEHWWGHSWESTMQLLPIFFILDTIPWHMGFPLSLILVWYAVAIYHCLACVNPLWINLNVLVHNSGLTCCTQHGAFARVRVNHVSVHQSPNSLQLMGDVGPLILFYLPMGCWL